MFLENFSYYQADFAQKWLGSDMDKIGVNYLPVYCPDLNSKESVWRLTGMKETHNRHLNDFEELYKTLFLPINRFQGISTSLSEMVTSYHIIMTN